MARESRPPSRPSSVAPETSFSNFWSGFAFGLGLSSEALSGKNAAFYKPYQPGFQLTLSQHIRSVFTGSVCLRTAYWEQTNTSTAQSESLIPLTITTRVEVTPPLQNILPKPLSTTVFPFVFAGPGGIFFTSPSERELPGRSYVLEAGAGVSVLAGRSTALRIAYRYWKSASSLNVSGHGAGVELFIGDFSSMILE
jgi:hypothetical protein